MRKALILVLLACALTFTACGNGWAQIFEEYPRVEYLNSDYSFDPENKAIEIFDGYVIDPDNPYEWMDTEEGYALMIYFVDGKTVEDETETEAAKCTGNKKK